MARTFEQLELALTPAWQHEAGLDELGLEPGDLVRFRRPGAARWTEGVVTDRHRDGSVGLRDAHDRDRAIAPERLQVRRPGPRGGLRWAPVGGAAQDGAAVTRTGSAGRARRVTDRGSPPPGRVRKRET